MSSDPFATHKVRWLVYTVGIPQDPSNPFGRNVLRVYRNRAVLENESRSGHRARYTGNARADLLEQIVDQLRIGGFPAHVQEPIPPGSACTISAMRVEGELTTGAMLSTTTTVGYAAALAQFEAVIHQLSGGELASTPTVEVPGLSTQPIVRLDDRKNPAAPPFSARSLDMLGSASDWAREFGHNDDVTAAHLLVAFALSENRYLLDRASLPSLEIGNAVEALLPEEEESCEDLEDLSGVMKRAQHIAAEEDSLETTVRHLLVSLAEGPEPIHSILAKAGLTRATTIIGE